MASKKPLTKSQIVSQLAEKFELVFGDILHPKLDRKLLEEPLRADGGMDNDEQGRLVIFLVEFSKEFSGKRRLSRADVSHDNGKPFPRVDRIFQLCDRRRLLGTVVVEPAVDNIGKRMFAQLIVFQIIHALFPRAMSEARFFISSV